MKGFATTYRGMFECGDAERTSLSSIEIPIIQRDYAQGREDVTTTTIRREFLGALIRALTQEEPIGLDFVYGEVTDGVLKPLDGQQRLTTLFLLHWYVASRAGTLDADAPWTRLRYSTRLSAEYFCKDLAAHPFPAEEHDPVAWITDQPWFLFPWQSDPTIRSMLVVIRAIHEALCTDEHDFPRLWERLAATDDPAISFLFLPLDDMESGDDLYIKMNSRGKPLTEFEIFKARLQKLLAHSGRQEELNRKLDGEWSDLLWKYKGDNHLVDEEFMNYFTFIVDVCEWRTGSRTAEPLLERAQRVFVDHDEAQVHLDFLFFAFDTWVGVNPSDDLPAEVFASLLRVRGDKTSGLLLFERQERNLFATCLDHYGTPQFTLAEAILLFAVLIHRQHGAEDRSAGLAQRLRTLRNLAESAPDDVRNEYMPELITSTSRVMTEPIDTHLDHVTRFNRARVDDEVLKRAFLKTRPELRESLWALEDHDLLRGRLFAFTLDSTLTQRGETFRRVTSAAAMPHLAAALLTKGDYSRKLGSRDTRRQLGVAGPRGGQGSWRDVLTSGSRADTARIRAALGRLLDDVASRAEPAAEALQAIVHDWLLGRQQSESYDWRYYFVRYPSMLDAPRGIYIAAYDRDGAGFGYRVDRLNGRDYRSAFTDPYLLAVWHECDAPSGVDKPVFRSWDYSGTERAMRLRGSGTGIRSADLGWEVLLPVDVDHAAHVREALAPLGLDGQNMVRTATLDCTGRPLDSRDRVQTGARLVRTLLAAGL